MMDIKHKNAKQIANTAIELFKGRGYSDVTVKDICLKVGISRSTFYSIFSSKDEIMKYVVMNLVNDFSSDFSTFVAADNDFERMMFLYSYYIDIAEEYGPELMAAMFKAELEKPIGVLDNITVFYDWFVKLAKNCQKTGIFRNQVDAEQLGPIGTQIVLASMYEWSRKGGSFSLRERICRNTEILYDVAPEYCIVGDKSE